MKKKKCHRCNCKAHCDAECKNCEKCDICDCMDCLERFSPDG